MMHYSIKKGDELLHILRIALPIKSNAWGLLDPVILAEILV